MATSRVASVLERDGAKDGLISCRGRGSVKRRFHLADTSSSDPQRNRLSWGAPMSLVRTLKYAAYLARGKKPLTTGYGVYQGVRDRPGTGRGRLRRGRYQFEPSPRCRSSAPWSRPAVRSPIRLSAQKALALHRLGMSATAIARMLGVSDKTVTKAINRARRDASNPSW